MAEGRQCTGDNNAQKRWHSVLWGQHYYFVFVFGFFSLGGKIKTVFSVGSLPLLSNVKSANTEVTMEPGKSWANI